MVCCRIAFQGPAPACLCGLALCGSLLRLGGRTEVRLPHALDHGGGGGCHGLEAGDVVQLVLQGGVGGREGGGQQPLRLEPCWIASLVGRSTAGTAGGAAGQAALFVAKHPPHLHPGHVCPPLTFIGLRLTPRTRSTSFLLALYSLLWRSWAIRSRSVETKALFCTSLTAGGRTWKKRWQESCRSLWAAWLPGQRFKGSSAA